MSRTVTRSEAGVIAAGVAGSALLALSLTGTLSAFTATLSNDNTAESGSVIMKMQEYQDSTFSTTKGDECISSAAGTLLTTNEASCDSAPFLFKEGDTPLVPGADRTSYFLIENTGKTPAKSFELVFGKCAAFLADEPGTELSTTNLCDKLEAKVVVVNPNGGTDFVDTKTLRAWYQGPHIPLTGEAGTPFGADGVAPGKGAKVTTTITFPDTASSDANDNAYQHQHVDQSTSWVFQS